MELTEDIITLEEILDIYESVELIPEPKVPFPQLDTFNTLFDLCVALYNYGNLSSEDIMDMFGLKKRQYSFCKSAGEYLELITKDNKDLILTPMGLNLFALNDKEIKLGIVKLILQHKPFYESFSLYLGNGEFPSSKDMFLILKNCEIYNINSDVTLKRRSSTVKGWINWIIDLISLN